ncbi:MAG: nuclear transport factor 2 family protein [Steroidobacteraceae bacterium]
MNKGLWGFITKITVVMALLPAVTVAQDLDEAVVTAQAHVFGPKDIDGQSIAGIPASHIRWLLDREAVRDVLTRYTRGLDRHDAILIASAFWPDAQINYGNTFSGLRDKFVAWSIADDKERFIAHTHNVTNQTIDFDGNIAHVETYLIGIEQRRSREVQVLAGRYIDRLERRDGEWRISVREFVLDTMGLADGSGFEPGKSCRGACGVMDRNDLSYARPLKRRVLPKPDQGSLIPK